MQRPFEVDPDYLLLHLEDMVSVTFGDLQSQFLIVPQGPHFVDYPAFQEAYEILKRETGAFRNFASDSIWSALRRNSLSFLVLRTILGMSPPEWAELARTEIGEDVTQTFARSVDTRCRKELAYFSKLALPRNRVALGRVSALVEVAIKYIAEGAPPVSAGIVHRLRKVDTTDGISSVQHVSAHHVPYAVLLYERYLGRPFASHRDSVSELVGDVMESAVEGLLSSARVTFRKTKRAERVTGFEQAPDFFIPDEFNPAAVIEAKITGDDGTARDKVTRIEKLATISDDRIRRGQKGFEVIACVDGRGFGVRRQDMRRMLTRTKGKVFTLTTLDRLTTHTVIREFAPL